MKIAKLHIANFKALTNTQLDNLPDAVVVAGPNGCGKSCILDAIRLIKSACGSYEQDEWSAFFGEFQINLTKDESELLSIFQDPTKQLRITAEFELSSAEIEFLGEKLESLERARLIRELRIEKQASGSPGSAMNPARQKEIDRKVAAALPALRDSLALPRHVADLVIEPGDRPMVKSSPLLQLVMSTYEPQALGIIDYHGPSRTYNRQRLNNINLTIEASEQRPRGNALYNWTSKYSNVKTELGAAYIRHLIASKADPAVESDDSLTRTLRELFDTFFPGKTFLGPQPTVDGRILFPVELSNGARHDIDDLSSGEKEVVYGFLRLHNSTPRNSILLIDEPELHLNPRLIGGLATFYFRHIGQAHNNQIWLVTHSDTLIREAASHEHYSVFHIHPCTSLPAGGQQASLVRARNDVDRIVFDLVGDLAAYRPSAKIVLFESTAEAAFDSTLTTLLFPEFAGRVNCVSAGDKRLVGRLHGLLAEMKEAGHVPGSFYSISDRDSEVTPIGVPNSFVWDRYHIENYLLEPEFVLRALRSLSIIDPVLNTPADVELALKGCSARSIKDQVAHEVRAHANRMIMGAISLSGDPASTDPASTVAKAFSRSQLKLASLQNDELAVEQLREFVASRHAYYETALADGSWVSVCRGRTILQQFVRDHVSGTDYERFRNIIVRAMASAGFQPQGMKNIITRILDGQAV